MKAKIIAPLLILPVLAFAERMNPKQPLRSFDQTQKTIQSLSGPDPYCHTCLPQDPTAPQTGKTDLICDDLFEAACLDADGKPKYEDRSKSLRKEMIPPIQEARNKTAKAMGFKDFDEALKTELRKNGIALNENIAPNDWKKLKREDDSYLSGSEDSSKIFQSLKRCNQELEELKALQHYSMTDLRQLRETAQKYAAFESKYRELSVVMYAKDIPAFIQNNISGKCSTLKHVPAFYKPEENVEIIQVCGIFPQIRKQAIALFRMEGMPQYQEQAEKFVRTNLLPELKYSQPNPSSSNTFEKSELETLRDQIQTARNNADSRCYTHSSLLTALGNKILEDFTQEVNRSKPTVDAIIDSFYTENKREQVTRIFQHTITDARSIVSQFVKDPKKREKILAGYENLKILWMEKPAESFYKKSDRGVLVLDEEKASPAFVREFMDEPFKIFSDPSLSFFTNLNADYMPSVKIGEYASSERLNLLPPYLYLSDKNPYSLLSVLGHEAGHKIGPEVSRINGYDLSPEYRELIACYKDRGSIHMQAIQADETIADYISSEILAMRLSQLPKNERRTALISSMEKFCIYSDMDSRTSSIACKATHPENSLRTGGIYGASPNLRKVIGCEGESSKYKSCGLGISLPSTGGSL